MVELATRSGVDVESYIRENRNSVEVADLLHDGLVKVWTGPYREDGDHFESLRGKADVWNQHKKTNPPRSSQRERSATPGTSQVVPQTSPVTEKPNGGSAPVAGAGAGLSFPWNSSSFTPANHQWEIPTRSDANAN
jgi:hypothetical protein